MRKVKRLVSWLTAFTITVSSVGAVSVSAADFSDTKNHWARQAISTWNDRGIVNGYDGLYRPDDLMSRAELATVISNLMSYQETNGQSFNDVTGTEWYADEIAKVSAAGVMKGDDEGNARPEYPITRQEAVTMIARAVGLNTENGGEIPYADANDVSDWAKPVVASMTNYQFITGTGENFEPLRNITRAEMVTVIDNLVGEYITEPGVYSGDYGNKIAIVKSDGVTFENTTLGGIAFADTVNSDSAQYGDSVTVGDVLVKSPSTSKPGSASSDATTAPDDSTDPDATADPDATTDPNATTAPAATSTPAASKGPVLTNSRVTGGAGGHGSGGLPPKATPTATADTTAAPAETTAPSVTTAPTVTAAPTVTSAPTVTATPAVTADPDATATPVVTDDPDATATPAVTADPDATATPVVTDDPDATATPVVTADPDATATPVVTDEPTTEYTVKIGTITGGSNGDVMLVKTAAKPAETSSPETSATPAVTAEPDVTAAPAVTDNPTPPTGEITFTFGDSTEGDITADLDFGNGLKYIKPDKSGYAAGAKDGDFEDGFTSPNRIKFGGKSTFTAGKMSRVFEFTPSSAGTIKVYFTHASSSGDPRNCVIQQNGTDIKTEPVAAGAKAVASVGISADYPVYIGCDNNIAIYGIVFIPAEATASLSAITPFAVPSADGEELVTEMKVKAGETITVKAAYAPGSDLKLTTDPEAVISGPTDIDSINGAAYFTFTMPAADTTVDAEYTAVVAPGDITVDASKDTDESAKTFKTVNEAIAYAKTLNSHASEADRIVIDVVPGTYREQIMIDVNYLTIQKAAGTTGDVLFTWYYGIGYQYYSTGSNGFYSKEAYETNKAAGTVASRGVDRWGCATRLTASNFIAKNIIFENSFNRYVTQEELDDGVFASPVGGAYSDTGGKPDRSGLTAGSTEVYNRTYTERAAAIAIEDTCDKTEFYNCQFLSSQDTVYSGSKANRIYFKDCVIEGQTDYIFGGNTLVFDNCDFSWAGYGNEKSGGHVTAVKNSSTDKGYLLYGGRVVAGGLKGGQFTQGDFGRPWGGNDSPTAVIGVQVMNLPDGNTSAINANGWSNWSTPAKESKYYEYGTLDTNGKTIDLTNRNALTPDVWEALVFNPYSYLVREGDDWDPMNVKGIWEPVIADMEKLTIPESDTLKLGDDGVYEVSGNFTLPTTIEGYEAYDIHFVSNNEDYAKIDPATGVVTVTRPILGNIDTTITAYIKLKNSTMAGPVGASKEIAISITTNPSVDPEPFQGALAAAKKALEDAYSEKNSYGMTVLDRQAPIPVIDEIDGVKTTITAEFSGFINEDGTIVRNAYASEDSLGSIIYTIECIKDGAAIKEVITYDVTIPTDKADILYEDFEGGYSIVGGSVIDDASGESGKAAKGALASSFDVMPCADDTVVVSYRVLGTTGTVTLKDQAGADYLTVAPADLTDDWNTVEITIDQAAGTASVVVNGGAATEVAAATTISDTNKIASIAFANGTYDDISVLAHPDVTKVYSTFWRANEGEVNTPANTYLMRGMTIMYSPDKKGTGGTVGDITFSCGLSSNSVNGSWSNGVASNNSLKFVAPADGVWTVYAIPGSGKAFHVGNASDDQTMTGENKATSLSVNVKKGETYYSTVAGSKGNYLGAKFVPTTEGDEAPQTYITTVFDFQKPAAGEYEMKKGETKEFYAINSKGGTETAIVSVPTEGDPKFYNTNWSDWVSVNPVVTITVPVVNGSIITVGDTYQNGGGYTINGKAFTGGNNSYTYYGTEKTVDIVITTGGYFRTITVESPEHPSADVPVIQEKTVNGTITNLDDADKSVVKLVGKLDSANKVLDVTDGAFSITLTESETFTVSGVYGGESAYTISGDTEITYDSVDPVIDATKVVPVVNGGTHEYQLGDGSEVPAIQNLNYTTFVTSDGLVTFKNMKYHNEHGVTNSGGDLKVTIKVPAGKSTITFGGCQFAGATITAPENVTPESASQKTTGCNDPIDFTYDGDAADLTFTINGGAIYLHYIKTASEAVTDTDPTTAPTTEPSETDAPEPTDAPSASPEVTDAPAISESDWTNNSSSDTATVTIEDDAYVMSYDANSGGQGFSYDLKEILAQPMSIEGLDLTTADGILTVSYDVFMPSDAQPTSNYFIEISGSKTINGWSGGAAQNYGRISGYATWNDVKALAGQTATNASTDGIKGLGDIRNKDNWVTVVNTIDLKNGTFQVVYDGTDSGVLTGTATTRTNDLFLNVQPTDQSNADHVVSIKIKNITATYAPAGEPEPTETPAPSETATPAPIAKVNVAIDLMNQNTTNTFLTAEEVESKSATSFGVTADLKRTEVNENLSAAEEGAAIVNLKNVKYHSPEHGVNPGTAEVYVPGYTKITIGTCNWGGNVTLKADGSEVASVNTSTGVCYHNNTTANVVVMYYNSDKPALLEISGGSYWPYIAFESVDAEDVPNTVDITYELGDVTDTVGTVPTKVTADMNSAVSISKYGLLYKEGYTLTAWTPDGGTTQYKVGESFTADKDMTLTPVFTKNADNAKPSGEVVFDFQQQNGAPVIAWQNASNIYVAQGKTSDGTPIDVKIDVNTNPGKLNNASWSNWAQCNTGTVFTVPVVNGATVTVGTIMNSTTEKAYSINGVSKTGNNQSEIIAEDITTADIAFTDVGYIRTVSVTYP